MKSKVILSVLVAAAAVAIVAVVGSAGTGNGLPSGPHFNLNIIGAPKDKNPDAGWDNPQRHTIMVDLDGHTNIYMQQGDDFAVIDADGTDGDCRFQLGEGRYEVYAAALGKPNKSVTITPEATFDADTGDIVFYLGSITLEHNKKPKWERVTGMFLVTVDITVDDTTTSYHNAWVFDIPELIDYWWNYDNSGCKLTQVRFYKVDTIPEEGT
jgi:hypothetical protein